MKKTRNYLERKKITCVFWIDFERARKTFVVNSLIFIFSYLIKEKKVFISWKTKITKAVPKFWSFLFCFNNFNSWFSSCLDIFVCFCQIELQSRNWNLGFRFDWKWLEKPRLLLNSRRVIGLMLTRIPIEKAVGFVKFYFLMISNLHFLSFL